MGHHLRCGLLLQEAKSGPPPGKGNANKIDNAAGRKRLSKALVLFLSQLYLLLFAQSRGDISETIRPRGTSTIDLNLHISLRTTTKIHRSLLSETGFTKRRCNGPQSRVNSKFHEFKCRLPREYSDQNRSHRFFRFHTRIVFSLLFIYLMQTSLNK